MMLWILLLLLAAWSAMGAWQRYKPLPEGVGEAWPARSAESARLLVDETWYDARGQRHYHQAIFDEALGMIGQARRLVVVDMFLFNDFAGEADDAGDMRPLSAELTQALIAQKRRHPTMSVRVITDPLNTLYDGLAPEHLSRLKDAGIELIMTELSRLRASNPLWSGLWHLGLDRLGNDDDGGWLPNPLGKGKITLRSYLAMANFRANHRKTLVVDNGDGWAGLVTSANPHDASSRHDNLALRFEGDAALDLLASERQLAGWSGADDAEPSDWPEAATRNARSEAATLEASDAAPRLRILTEAAIRDALLERIRRAENGDRLDAAVFYLSHRPLIEALKSAAHRGVAVRVLLDPNRQAFGMKKSGVPNRPVAAELARAGIDVRFCVTQGEQCHTKLLLHRAAGRQPTRPAAMILGSANYTRRNLDNLNLETSVELAGRADTPALDQAAALFERQWHSRPGRRTSEAFDPQQAPGKLTYWRYRFMEATGLSTF